MGKTDSCNYCGPYGDAEQIMYKCIKFHAERKDQHEFALEAYLCVQSFRILYLKKYDEDKKQINDFATAIDENDRKYSSKQFLLCVLGVGVKGIREYSMQLERQNFTLLPRCKI